MPTREENSQKERNKALIRSFIKEVLNEHNLLAIEKYFTKDFIEGIPHHAEKEGEGFKQFLTEFFEAFPDMRTTIEHIVAENNLVTVFLSGSGTHKGAFKGVPPTNKQVNIRSADLYRIGNGVITGHWEMVDQLNLLKQTGTLLSESTGEEFKDARVVWIRGYK